MELFRALGALVEGADAPAVAAALGMNQPLDPVEQTNLFTFRLYPYASVYLGPEGMLGGEARDRIAGFWRAIGRTPPDEPDHLCVLLALYAELSEAAERQTNPPRKVMIDHARRALFWEHLASWLPIYLAQVHRIGTPAYRQWGTLLEAALLYEAKTLGPPEQLSLHLRAAPNLPDPRQVGGESFLAALLAPVRSGFIIVRDDLAEAGEALGVGLRHGERRFVLKAMFAQERCELLRWLGALARRNAAAHADLAAPWSDVTAFWSGRALASAQLFEALAEHADPVAS
ncbi:MAG: TorD/DmsD family molecular chaperone [Bacillati bacterium]